MYVTKLLQKPREPLTIFSNISVLCPQSSPPNGQPGLWHICIALFKMSRLSWCDGAPL